MIFSSELKAKRIKKTCTIYFLIKSFMIRKKSKESRAFYTSKKNEFNAKMSNFQKIL